MKPILIAFFFFVMISAFAQHQLSGTVKDVANGTTVPSATVALLRSDSSVITGMMTDKDGKFAMNNIAANRNVGIENEMERTK